MATLSLQERFWSKVNKDTSSGCWEWLGWKSRGYGRIDVAETKQTAHRLAWQWEKGPVPDGLILDHICHNKACVNPRHLRAVTNSQNMQNRRGARSDSKSGVRGVMWHSRSKRWAAEVVLNGKCEYRGWFTDITDAEAAVTAWRRKYMPHSLMDSAQVATE